MKNIQGFPLSPQQKYLWKLQSNNKVYTSQAVITLEGKVDLRNLKVAVRKVVDRHEILRTTFPRRSGMSIPFQTINEDNNFFWQNIDLIDLDKSARELELATILNSEKSTNFNLDRESLLRILLVKIKENIHYLIVTLPSLCADSQTINNLVLEIALSYDLCLQKKDFSEEPVQYIQFSQWQNELSTEEIETDYWQQETGKFSGDIILPEEWSFSKDREIKYNSYFFTLESELTDKLKSTVREYNTELSNFLRACWYILIWKLSSQSNIAIANLIDGRTFEELESTLGLLAQFLPINCTIAPQFTVKEIIDNLTNSRAKLEESQENYLKEDIIERISLPTIGFEFDNLDIKYNVDSLSFSLLEKDISLNKFKIELVCQQALDCLSLKLTYNPNQYTPESITRLAQQFNTLIESIVANPQATVKEINILNCQQKEQLLVEFNHNKADYPQDKSIQQLFTAQAIKTPNKIAVIYNSEKVTYRELNERTDILANYLRRQGVTSETLVGLYLERSVLTIVGLLAIFKAGAAYLPLDPALPQEGLAFRLQDLAVSVLLTQRSLVPQISAKIEHLICLDTDWEKIETENQNTFHQEVKPNNLAYAIYTSGSTGTPKAVGVEHQQLVNYIYSIIDRLAISPGASFATVSTFAADLGNTMLFPALCTGGCLHIIPQNTASDPQEFNNYCQHHPIDYLKIVPSHLSALLASEKDAKFLPRKKLILGGEASNWQLIAKIQQHNPSCQIFNHYGPTETTVGVLTYEIGRETGGRRDKETRRVGNGFSPTVPIGKPLPNNQVYILNEQLQPVPIGVSGELYIGGAQVSRGYLNRPKLTKERFIQNPIPPQSPLSKKGWGDRLYKTGDKARYLPNGNIEFLGRIDRQVKIRGFRIELGEIETKLQQHPGIQSAVVVAQQESLDNKRLVAYIITDPQFRLLHQHQDVAIAKELRNFCLTQFPDYMIPATFVTLKVFPLTANGKIDYQALPTPEQIRPELEQLYIAPRSPEEAQLGILWTEVLGLEKIGIYDNFFELGGHSLLITQLLAKVRNTFEVDLPLKDLFDAPTIAELAQRLEILKDTATHNWETKELKNKGTSINLHSEAVLDPNIVPGHNTFNRTTTPQNIFLTGVTGFLGAFLLNELLQTTEANIYCLIRAENDTLGQKRIEDKLKSYLLWDLANCKRIIPVVGDLSQPLLGLSSDRFAEIARTVDVIYHNGAWVNFTYPYSQLKAVNVFGTQEILRLAVKSKLKPVHFISTIGVVGGADRNLEIIREDTPVDRSEQIDSGYTQSKWVAEKLVTIARDRNIPITIYRPGRISGDSQTGVCNPNDHTFRMIRGCIQLGCVFLDDSLVNLIPVDYAVKAIVHLSSQPKSLGKTFHLFNPQPTPWNEVANSIISLGYPLKQLNYEKWRKELLATLEQFADNPLSPLIGTFAESNQPNKNTEENINQKIAANNTNSGLAGTSIICPPCDRQLLSTYFSYLIDRGYLRTKK